MSAGQPRNGDVIFDVDGTLLDTNYLHVVAWWEAFRERGHDIRCAGVHRALGMGSAELVERVLGQPDPAVIDAHSRYFAPYLGRMRPLPGAPDLLAATVGLGLQVMLATSAQDDEVDLMLDAIGVRDVISSGAVERAKPDPDIVERALSESGTDRARAVMVGDAVWDVIAAPRAGLSCTGLLCGGTAEEQLYGAGAAEVYPDPAALLGNLQASAIGQLRERAAQAMLGPRGRIEAPGPPGAAQVAGGRGDQSTSGAACQQTVSPYRQGTRRAVLTPPSCVLRITARGPGRRLCRGSRAPGRPAAARRGTLSHRGRSRRREPCRRRPRPGRPPSARRERPGCSGGAWSVRSSWPARSCRRARWPRPR